jgi:hypothetical protein
MRQESRTSDSQKVHRRSLHFLMEFGREIDQLIAAFLHRQRELVNHVATLTLRERSHGALQLVGHAVRFLARLITALDDFNRGQLDAAHQLRRGRGNLVQTVNDMTVANHKFFGDLFARRDPDAQTRQFHENLHQGA